MRASTFSIILLAAISSCAASTPYHSALPLDDLSRFCVNPDGRNAFSGSCKRFVICQGGKIAQFESCPQGTVFDPSISNCIQVGLVSSPRQCATDETDEADARDERVKTFCKGMLFRQALRGKKPTYGDRDLFPMPRFPCRKYISCSLNGSFTVGSCRSGTAFAQRVRKCVPRHLVKDCRSGQEQSAAASLEQ